MTDLNPSQPPDTSVFLNTALPNVARIFDYLAGGTTNFESDRQAAAKMLEILPSLSKWVRLRRAFIQEAAYQLSQAGFTQFLDLASGMPSEDHIHAFAPNARIIYSDINPVAVSYGASLFEDNPSIAYIRSDARQLKQLLNTPEVHRLIHTDQPVAIGLNALMLFLSEEDNITLFHQLHEWAPPGSQIFLVFQTRGDFDMPEAYQTFQELCFSAGLPIRLYTHSEALALTKPWRPARMQSIAEFLSLPETFISEADRTVIEISFYAVFLEK